MCAAENDAAVRVRILCRTSVKDPRNARSRSVKNPVQLARGTRRLGPSFIRGMRSAGRHRYETFETGWAVRQQGGHLLKYGTKIEALS